MKLLQVPKISPKLFPSYIKTLKMELIYHFSITTTKNASKDYLILLKLKIKTILITIKALIFNMFFIHFVKMKFTNLSTNTQVKSIIPPLQGSFIVMLLKKIIQINSYWTLPPEISYKQLIQNKRNSLFLR